MTAAAAMDCDDNRRFSASSTVFSDLDTSRGLGDESGRRSGVSVTPELQAKAEEKVAWVQELVRNLERAIKNMQPEDERFLKKFTNPNDPCFATLCNLLIARKYSPFVLLRCVVLRAIQMILKTTVALLSGSENQEADIGMTCFGQLAGKQLTAKVYREVYHLAESSEQAVISCDALLVLAELGPEAFGVRLVERVLDLFKVLPDRAHELTEVALRTHAWGGGTRTKLLEATPSHRNGNSLVEVLIQMVNRSDHDRTLRAVKVLTGCLMHDTGQHFLYTNDAHVLVEILLRELPNHVNHAKEFDCFATCMGAMQVKSKAARDHRRADVVQVLQDLRDDEQNAPAAREKCAQVLALMATA